MPHTSVVRLHLQWLSLNLVSPPLSQVPLLPPEGGIDRDANIILMTQSKGEMPDLPN